jgi:hypothetical protein
VVGIEEVLRQYWRFSDDESRRPGGTIGRGKRGEGRGKRGLLIGMEGGRITQGVKRMKRGK